MSKKLLEAVWESGLPQPMKTVLTILAWYGRDDGGSIFPSAVLVAQRTSYSTRNVHLIIRKAIGLGILVPVKRRGAGRGYVTEYRMDVAKLPPISANPGSHSVDQSPHSDSDSKYANS